MFNITVLLSATNTDRLTVRLSKRGQTSAVTWSGRPADHAQSSVKVNSSKKMLERDSNYDFLLITSFDVSVLSCNVSSMILLHLQHALALPFFVFLSKDIIHYVVAFSQSGMDYYFGVLLLYLLKVKSL